MPKYEIIRAHSGDYRRLVTPDLLDFPGSVFYHPDFLEIAADILKLKFAPVICMMDGGVIGLANYLVGEKKGFRIAAIPALFQYYGPVGFADDTSLFEQLTAALREDVDTAVFSIVPGFSAGLDVSGWRRRERLTYYLTPDTFENMKKRCRNNARGKINKALKAGAKFDEVGSFPYRLYQDSFDRQGVRPPLGEKELTSWVNELTECGLAKSYVAILERKTAAFITVLSYRDKAYLWLAGASSGFRRSGVNSYLVLKVGEHLHRQGITGWDMVGADIESIREFKKSFGGEPITHVEIEKNFTFRGAVYRKLMKMKARING